MKRARHGHDVALALLVILLSIPLSPHAPSQAPAPTPTPPQPVARVESVVDEYFGTRVTDPYRWMEDLSAPAVQQWIKAQADFTDRALAGLSTRDAFLRRLEEVSTAAALVRNVRKHGDLYFFTRRAPGEQDNRLYVRRGLSGPERLLVDPARVVTDGQRYSLGAWSVSPDARYVSFNVAAGGSEQSELRVLEVATGRLLDDRIPRTNFGAGDWLSDGKAFFYPRFPPQGTGAPAAEKYQKIRVYRHTVGTDPAGDPPVFGYGLPDTDLGLDMIWQVEPRRHPRFALGIASTGVSPARAYYLAPLSALRQSPVPWRRVLSLADEVSAVEVHGDWMYLLTSRGAARRKIVRTPIQDPDPSKATFVFSGGEAVVTRMAAQKDALYVETLDGGNYVVWRVDYESGRSRSLPLPYGAAAVLAHNTPEARGAFLSLASWTRSPAHFHYDPDRDVTTPTHLVPPSPIDMSGLEFVNARARSHDGTMVPLVIIQKKGLPRDGSRPTLMHGYGAYGIENTSPFFDTASLPWIERGGVIVWTGIRGGGEFGEEWHRAGQKGTKPNTWKDFIACAEYLIEQKVTSPERLAIQGASAGGITISNAIVERPDLFAAAVIGVGMTNPVRSETTANGQPNVPEFGTVTDEAGFRALLAMDGYLKVRDGGRYPAVLLTTGINDARVDPWMSAKMAARLQAASASGEPVLLRVDYDAGHGSGTARTQQNRQLADVYAFLADQLGGLP